MKIRIRRKRRKTKKERKEEKHIFTQDRTERSKSVWRREKEKKRRIKSGRWEASACGVGDEKERENGAEE
jgi:hypothetical protein